jgi:archaellin
MMGQVYGTGSGSGSDAEIVGITFTIGLAPGSPPLDLSGMTIIYSTPAVSGISSLTYTSGTAGTDVFTAKVAGTASSTLEAQQQNTINFKIAGVGANTVMNFEIRPSVGAALPFSKTTPAVISTTNVLY